jgi:hypothetical protein
MGGSPKRGRAVAGTTATSDCMGLDVWVRVATRAKPSSDQCEPSLRVTTIGVNDAGSA